MQRFLLFATLMTMVLLFSWSEQATSQKISFIKTSTGLVLAAEKPDTVRCNGNWASSQLKTTNHPLFNTGTEAFREFFMMAHGSRIRTSNPIVQIRMAHGTGVVEDTITIKAWRHVFASYYNLVWTSENIAPSMVASSVQTHDLVTTLVGHTNGDHYSVHYGGGNARSLPAPFEDFGATPDPEGNESMKPGQAGMLFARPTNSAYPKGTYNWANTKQSGSTWLEHEYIPVEFYCSPAPQVVILGASIITGHNEHRSFWENAFFDSTGTQGASNFLINDSSSTALDSTPAWYIMGTGVRDSTGAKGWFDGVVGAMNTWPWPQLTPTTNYMGWSYQNMGRGSDQSHTLLASIVQRCLDLKPRAAFIGVGSADANFSKTVADHVDQMTEVMDSLDAHNIIGVFRGIVPRTKWTGGDDVATRAAKADTVEAYNRAIEALAINYVGANGTKMLYAPVYQVLGRDDPIAPASAFNNSGNDYRLLITLYQNTDSIHLNGAGAKKMSEAIIEGLRRP